MTGTSAARAYALQLLYAADMVEPGEAGSEPDWAELLEVTVTDDNMAYAQRLVAQVNANRQQIDGVIAAHSRNWRLERMSNVDRNILRLACAELQAVPEVPAKVVINEAVELGKRFGSEGSGAFINGVIDRVARELRPTELAPPKGQGA